MNYDELLQKSNALRLKTPRARYAPSPTGPLHLGNVRTALLAWLQARLVGGVFIMRNEDLDTNRVIEGSAGRIYEDLRWLGLDWDEGEDVGGPVGSYVQSERTALYREALDRLRAMRHDGHPAVFRCYCSRRDVREAASAPHQYGRLIYPGTCRGLSEAEEDAVREEKPDRIPIWRFWMPRVHICVQDEVAGEFCQQLDEEVGDFVLRRADDLFAYQLAVVVDDALMGVTDVLRGRDLLSSTPRQIALFEALGFEVPTFWHVPLMRDESGERMSKREESLSLQTLRANGETPDQVVGRLAHSIGLAAPGERISAQDLLGRLSLDDFKDALRRASDSDK